jgi:hypothetical protein
MPAAKAAMNATAGPLVVSEANPRYFTVASSNVADRKVVYLTGSHIWNTLHDGMGPGSDCAETPEKSDYSAYLQFLKDHGHNLIRLWRWEHGKSQAAGGSFHLCMTPQPWPRTGYVLANPGEEYLVLQPSAAADPFTVTLEAGTYAVQWYSVNSRETKDAGKVTVESSTTISFSAPFEAADPAVLYLKVRA